MIEIIKVMLSTVKDITSIFKNSKELINSSKKNDIGYELFTIYTEMNELLIRGDTIIQYTENFVIGNSFFPYLEEGGYKNKYFYLKNLIETQINSIERIINIIKKLSEKLSVIDGKFKRQILSKITEKRLILELYRCKLLDTIDPISGIPGKIEDTENNKKTIKKHLEENNLKKELDDMQNILENFKDILLENFSLSDVLLKVRDNKRYIKS